MAQCQRFMFVVYLLKTHLSLIKRNEEKKNFFFKPTGKNFRQSIFNIEEIIFSIHYEVNHVMEETEIINISISNGVSSGVEGI